MKTFADFLRDMSAGAQGASAVPLDLSVGSVLRALFEGNVSVASWLQWLIMGGLRMTRAATSQGVELDSWVADFGLTRLPASAARGTASFSRYSPVGRSLIPVGTAVKTLDSSTVLLVVTDITDAHWSVGDQGYAFLDGIGTINVPVIAAVPGAAGNVLPGSISLIASPLAGVDTVSNSAALSGGFDAESDQQLRARFQNYMDSRSRGTSQAIRYVAQSIQQGVTVTVVENADASGYPLPGNFVVSIDDGSGAPTPDLIARVALAIDQVRPIATTFAVLRPVVVSVAVEMTIGTINPASLGTLRSLVQITIIQHINSLPIGGSLTSAELVRQLYLAHDQLRDIAEISFNGQQADVQPPGNGVIKTSSVVVH